MSGPVCGNFVTRVPQNLRECTHVLLPLHTHTKLITLEEPRFKLDHISESLSVFLHSYTNICGVINLRKKPL